MAVIAKGRRVMLCAGAAVALGAAMGLGRPEKALYEARNLVSDGSVPAEHMDRNLVNPWGLAVNPTGVWWVSDNHTGVSTLYDGKGAPQPLIVTIPGESPEEPGEPTGIVFNGGLEFVITDGQHAEPARFLFATEAGMIAAWAPGIPPPPPSKQSQIVVNKSDEGAKFTGLAIARTAAVHGARLYAADFMNKRVDIFDGEFHQLTRNGAFVDAMIPRDFGPFGIQVLSGEVYVTYAKVGENGDEVVGPGLGYVDVFDADGRLLRRLVTRGPLNAPWGLAMAPGNFGPLGNSVLVGNFGDGRISAFDRQTGAFKGQLTGARNRPIEIDGIWGIAFGNGGKAGPTNTLFFAAGVDDEAHGLFGSIEALGSSPH